jgi:hypothetical protein
VVGSGGRVTAATCKEQLLYEIHDPAAYATPDVVADFTRVSVEDAGPDRVAVDGAAGRPRPDVLKVSLGYRDGYIGEGLISYAGPGALARARLAGQIVIERLRLTGVAASDVRADLIGVDALYGFAARHTSVDPYDVRVRVVGRTATARDAERIGREVESLYTNGPCGGAGVTRTTREVLSVASTFVPRAGVRPAVRVEVV